MFMCNFFPIVIKLQNLNEVLLKGFQLGCKINDLCTNLHPSLVGVLTGMQLVKILCTCTQCHHKVKLTAVYWQGLAPHNAYTTMDASPFPPLQSVIIERRWLPSILHMRISMVLHLQHHISRTIKAHKVLHQIFAIVSFFSILFHFFSFIFFLFWKKRGDCDDDAADW